MWRCDVALDHGTSWFFTVKQTPLPMKPWRPSGRSVNVQETHEPKCVFHQLNGKTHALTFNFWKFQLKEHQHFSADTTHGHTRACALPTQWNLPGRYHIFRNSSWIRCYLLKVGTDKCRFQYKTRTATLWIHYTVMTNSLDPSVVFTLYTPCFICTG